MSDTKFYQEVKFIFENHLSPKRDHLQLRIRNTEKDHILGETEMNYSKVFFDSDLNIYKLDKEGKVTKVDNDSFEAIVMKQE